MIQKIICYVSPAGAPIWHPWSQPNIEAEFGDRRKKKPWWRQFWVQTILEFYEDSEYIREFWKNLFSYLEKRENIRLWNREIEKWGFGADYGFVEQNGWHHSIRHEILHKEHFEDFFRKFWSDMNCRELQADFGFPAGFWWYHWIRHEIIPKICASEHRCSKWEPSDPEDRFWFFFRKKIKLWDLPNLAL